jgi:hypothetical protein
MLTIGIRGRHLCRREKAQGTQELLIKPTSANGAPLGEKEIVLHLQSPWVSLFGVTFWRYSSYSALAQEKSVPAFPQWLQINGFSPASVSLRP